MKSCTTRDLHVWCTVEFIFLLFTLAFELCFGFFKQELIQCFYLPQLQIEYSSFIMSSCVQPLVQGDANPVVLLHCFDRLEAYIYKFIQ